MMMTQVLRHPALWWILAIVVLLSHALFYSSLMDFDVVDDAYISFRYAHNAARGYGLTFNIGERRVEGYTNFLWTVMMIPVLWSHLPVHTASIILGAAWAIGCILLLARLASTADIDARIGMVAAVLLAADGSFALWAVGGLESPLFAFLVLGGAIAYLREIKDPKVPPISGAWFALAGMARPEGLLLYALTGAHQITTRLLDRRTQHGKMITLQDWQRLGLFVLIWVPWFAFRWRYYGFPLPNTFYAKVTLGDSGAQRARGLAYLQTFVRLHLGYPALIVAVVPLLRRTWRRWSSYLFLLVVVYGGYVSLVGGDWSVGRFFVPLMPMYYVLLVAGVFAIGTWIKDMVVSHRHVQPWLWRWLAGAAIVILATATFVQSSLNGEKALFLDPFDARLAGQARTAMGKWLRTNVPADTFVAVDAAGQIPFYSDLRALDLYGLNDLVIAHHQVENMGQGTPGHEKMDMNYVIFVAQPDYIIIYGTAFDWLSAFSYERVDLPWTDDPILKTFLGVYKRL
jgi:arabinofuranosyltransferase